MTIFSENLNWYKSRRGSFLMMLFCLFFLIIGVGLTIAMIGMSLDWVEAEGVVIDFRSFYDGDSRINAYKIQFFEQLTGTQLIADVWLGSGQKYNVGQKLPILYPPRLIYSAAVHDGLVSNGAIKVKDPIDFYLIPIGLDVVGGIGAFGFLRLFIRSRSHKPRAYPISS
ncbi:DUF3592 domain-containing protein [Candidatus Bathyarchaeota archaeon]|nr:DUF3592 domain-containing protein [Candidatus Bathyarchaeota archaeon]